MRRIIVFVLLPCLFLAGCGLSPVVESSLEAPSLPVPVPPESAALPVPGSNTPPDGAVLPLLETPESGEPTVRGPAGTVRAMSYLGREAYDPVYGDVDGDGETELVYWCAGPTSGVNTVGICVYGLEQDWPVLKGSALLTLSNCDDIGLEREEDRVVFLCTPLEWDAEKRESVALDPLRLSVALVNGSLLLNGGALPDLIQRAGGSALGAVGSSFSALRERLGEEALFDCPSCLIWQKTIPVPDGDPAGEGEVWTLAAVTDNGVTVTGTIAYPPPGSDSMILNLWGESLEPIPPVEDPEALAVLTAEEREARLGPCHFSWIIGSGISYLHECWFTEDGKLLYFKTSSQMGSSDDSFTLFWLWDITDGIPRFVYGDNGADDPANVVTVHQETIPTRIENAERWEAFLAAAEQGVADGVTLRLVYEEGTFDLDLRCDGEVFTLVDEGHVTTCKYLLADEEDAPRPGAKYRRAVHYLLSDDPDMTWEQYFSRLVSSYALPGDEFPATASLFSVFE